MRLPRLAILASTAAHEGMPLMASRKTAAKPRVENREGCELTSNPKARAAANQKTDAIAGNFSPMGPKALGVIRAALKN
jgi:hypothetical protein